MLALMTIRREVQIARSITIAGSMSSRVRLRAMSRDSPMSAMGRALLLGRRRRRAGMLRIAVARRRTTCHPASSPASATNVGQQQSVAAVRFLES